MIGTVSPRDDKEQLRPGGGLMAPLGVDPAPCFCPAFLVSRPRGEVPSAGAGGGHLWFLTCVLTARRFSGEVTPQCRLRAPSLAAVVRATLSLAPRGECRA